MDPFSTFQDCGWVTWGFQSFLIHLFQTALSRQVGMLQDWSRLRMCWLICCKQQKKSVAGFEAIKWIMQRNGWTTKITQNKNRMSEQDVETKLFRSELEKKETMTEFRYFIVRKQDSHPFWNAPVKSQMVKWRSKNINSISFTKTFNEFYLCLILVASTYSKHVFN